MRTSHAFSSFIFTAAVNTRWLHPSAGLYLWQRTSDWLKRRRDVIQATRGNSAILKKKEKKSKTLTSHLSQPQENTGKVFTMDTNSKYHWSEEETACFLSLWSSTEVQNKLEGTTRTKPVFEQIQREMAAAGYNRTIEQISNKLKKLKMEYRDQKKGPRRRRNPHFEILESVLGTRPACQQTGPLNSETAMFEVTVDYPTDDMLVQTSTLSGKIYLANARPCCSPGLCFLFV